MDKTNFVLELIDFLHIISPSGRERIYQNILQNECVVHCESNHLNLNLDDIIFIENQICKKYTNSYFIDFGINWSITTKDNLIESELQRASNMLINYFSFLSKYEKHASFIRTLTQMILGNNSLLIL